MLIMRQIQQSLYYPLHESIVPALIVGLGAPLMHELIIWYFGIHRSFSMETARYDFLIGNSYTRLVEYVAHRWYLHTPEDEEKNADVSAVAEKAELHMTKEHADHHNTQQGKNFCSPDPAIVAHAITSPSLFPKLFVVHYAIALILCIFFPIDHYVVVFFISVTLQFCWFEFMHYSIHLANPILACVPIYRRVFFWNQRRHSIHHDSLGRPPYQTNFGVSSAVFDWLFGTYRGARPKSKPA